MLFINHSPFQRGREKRTPSTGAATPWYCFFRSRNYGQKNLGADSPYTNPQTGMSACTRVTSGMPSTCLLLWNGIKIYCHIQVQDSNHILYFCLKKKINMTFMVVIPCSFLMFDLNVICTVKNQDKSSIMVTALFFVLFCSFLFSSVNLYNRCLLWVRGLLRSPVTANSLSLLYPYDFRKAA